uniref:Uncharacterized protein n=2 Tax=Nothobranchius pienaari TaxID=704102 RepID=A0A1A8PIL0_9TELE
MSFWLHSEKCSNKRRCSSKTQVNLWMKLAHNLILSDLKHLKKPKYGEKHLI